MHDFAEKQSLPPHRRGQTVSGSVRREPGEADPASTVPAIVREVLGAPGQLLDPATRAVMELQFGHDLSRVRVHTDSRAAESARRVLARAYTFGTHVVFGDGEYRPGTHRGRELLAHELAHTVQQTGGSTSPLSVASGAVPEQSAESAGRDIAGGRSISTGLPATPIGLARAPIPISAYPDDMLATELAEVQKRLTTRSYSGRDRDVDQYMALKRETDERATTAARAEAATELRSIDLPPREQRYRAPSKFLPGEWADDDIYPDREEKEIKQKENKAQEALYRQQEEAGRPERLALVRRYLTLHGVSRYDMADTLTHFLTVSDLRVLAKNELDPAGIFTRHYADKVIDVIDKIVPRDPIEDRENLEDLQRGAAAYAQTQEKIDAVSTGGPHALGGRVVGAIAAWSVGKDPQWGGEVGAMVGGVAGIRAETRYGTPSIGRSADEPTYPDTTHEVHSEIDRQASEPPTDQAWTSSPGTPKPADEPDLTSPGGIDVTSGGASPPRRETVEQYLQRGGVITTAPEGRSGTVAATPTRVSPSRVTARPMKAATPSDADVTSQPGMRTQFRAYPQNPQHHVFPQEKELQSWFEERFRGTSEDIHEYTLSLGDGEHQAIHLTGKGGIVKGVQQPDLKGWNQEWKDFKRDHPFATPQMIFERAGQLMDKYRISDASIARYKGEK